MGWLERLRQRRKARVAQRGSRRWLRRAIKVLAALIGLPTLALVVLMYTAAGRDQLRSIALSLLNERIAGTLEMDELERIDPSGISCRGVRLRDPLGEQVVAVDRLQLDLDAAALLDSHVLVDRLAIDALQLDLRHLDATDRGLLAAVKMAETKEEPSAEPSGWVIELSAIELRRAQLTADAPQLGTITVEELTADGRLRIDEHIDAELQALSLSLHDERGLVARLPSARAHYRTDGEPSNVALELLAGGAKLSLSASALAPPTPDWKQGPIKLDVAVANVRQPLWRLARIEPPEQLCEPIDLDLELRGTLADIDGRLKLSTPGGTALLVLTLDDQDDLSLLLSADDLDASKLWRGAPADPLTVALKGKARLGKAPEELPFELELARSRLGQNELPTVALSGRLEGDDIRALVLDASGYGANLKARGEATLDGSVNASVALDVPSIAQPMRLAGKKDARGAVRLEGKVKLRGKRIDASAQAGVVGLHVDDVKLDKATVAVTIKGDLPTPSVEAVVQTGRGSVAGTAFEPSTVRVAGGPDTYRLDVDANAAGNRIELDAQLIRRPDGVVLKGKGSGHFRGRPLSLRLEDTAIGFDGTVKVGSLELEALGQKASLRGALRGRSSEELLLETSELDLAVVSAALGIEPPLVGKARVRVSASGSIERPLINVSGSADDVRLPATSDAQLGRLSARWTGTIDTARGQLELRADSSIRRRGKPGPAAELTLRGEFAKRGAWADQIPKADLNVRFELRDLTVAYLEALLGRSLPVTGKMGVVVTAQGPVSKPVIDVKARARLAHPESGDPLDANASAHYDDGSVDVMLDAADKHGQWIWLELGGEHAVATLPELLAQLQSLPDEASWRVRVRAEERRLDDIPIAIEWPDDIAPARVYGLVTATHEPKAEPSIDAMVDVLYPPVRKVDAGGKTVLEPRCRATALLARTHADVHDGELELRVLAGSRTRRWLKLKSNGKLALAPVLRGAEPALPSNLDYELDLARVPIEQLPVVCSTLRGSLRGSGRGKDVLGAKPQVALKLELDDMGLGGRESMAGHVELALDGEGTRLDARLAHRGHDSRARGELPLSLREGELSLRRDAPLKVDLVLDRLPLAVVIPPGAPVSRVRGHLDGTMKARGSLEKPRVSGTIDIVNAGVTATSVAQPLRRINGRIAFDNDTVRLHKLVAHDKSGKLELNGSVDIGKLPDAAAMRFDVALDDFPVRQDGQVAATVNLKGHIRADMNDKRTKVSVKLRDVDMWLEELESRGISLKLHPDIIDPRAPKAPAVATPSEPARALRLDLDLSEPFWVKRDDMAVKLSSRIAIRSSPEGTVVTGKATILRGYLQLLGRNFDIEKGSKLTFVGGSPPDPAVDIGAQFENRRSGQTIGVRITGRASKPELTFLVDGSEVTAGQAVAAMFGDRSSADETAADGQAKSFLAGVAGGMLALAARKELGAAAPIILVDPAEDTAHSRLRAGFELDKLVPDFMATVIRGVYVEGIVAGDDGTGTGGVHGGVLMDLFLPESLVLTGQYGPGETWAVDFGWEP